MRAEGFFLRSALHSVRVVENSLHMRSVRVVANSRDMRVDRRAPVALRKA
jgi:hypothetical protein